MKCEVFRNGTKVMGPLEYDVNKIKNYVTRQGCNGDLVPRILSRMLTIATIVVKPVREVKPNLILGQKYGAYTRRESTDEVIYDYKVVPQTPEEMRAKLLTRLSSTHDAYEGERVVHRGVAIKVDMEARINAKATFDLFKDGIVTATEWRGIVPQDVNDPTLINSQAVSATIPVTSVEEMGAVYGAIVSYLGRGFAVRSAVEDEIRLLTDSKLATFDVRSRFKDLVAA